MQILLQAIAFSEPNKTPKHNKHGGIMWSGFIDGHFFESAYITIFFVIYGTRMRMTRCEIWIFT